MALCCLVVGSLLPSFRAPAQLLDAATLDSTALRFVRALRARGIDTVGFDRVDCAGYHSRTDCPTIRCYLVFWHEGGVGKATRFDACFQYPVVAFEQRWVWRYCARHRQALHQQEPLPFRFANKEDGQVVIQELTVSHQCCVVLQFTLPDDQIEGFHCEFRFSKTQVFRRKPSRRNISYRYNRRLRLRKLQRRLEKRLGQLQSQGGLKPLERTP